MSLIDNSPDPLGRIRRPELVAELVSWAAAVCRLGEVSGFRASDVGYDDCNIILATTTGDYLVKVFTTARPPELTARYVDVIERAIAAGVNHPRLLPADGRTMLEHPASGNLLVVMELVDGSTFLDLDAFPDRRELEAVVDQVQRLHGVDHVPEFVEDWWATTNIAALAAEIGPRLDADDRPHVAAAVARFAEIDLAGLPHALVHGDLTKANVLRADIGEVVIIDFAAANRYPRIHELAMIIVNLMHGDPMSMADRIDLVAGLYGRRAALTSAEQEALPKYVFAGAAMELLGATREWAIKGNRSRETKFLMELGRTAVRMAAC